MVPYSKLIKALEDRKSRKKEGLFVIEGPKLLEEALQARLGLKAVLYSESLKDLNLLEKVPNPIQISEKELQELSSTVTPQGIIAVAEIPEYNWTQLRKEPFFLILDGIQDPGNLGTLFRTALAAGAGGLVLLKNTVDPFNPKVVRSAMGALFKLPFITDVEIETLESFKGVLWAAMLEEAKPYYELKPQQGLGLIIGNEGQGISPEVARLATERVHIPIDTKAESLNAAIAAGVLLFYLRQNLVSLA